MHNIEPQNQIPIIDDVYIAKIEAENAKRLQDARDLQEEQKIRNQTKRVIKSPHGMIDFVRNSLQFANDFTIKDICEACNIPYENRSEVNKVYSTMLAWRNTSKDIFEDPKTTEMLGEYKTDEAKWNAFIKLLNADDIFLLYRDREKGGFVYFQPSWEEKEILDYFRMDKHYRGQITVLAEMTLYGEDFSVGSELLVSPEDLKLEMEGVRTRAKLKVDTLVGNKIKELESAEELQLSE